MDWSSYALGVLTVPAVAGVGYALIWIVANVCWVLANRWGWFVEFGAAGDSPPTWYATRIVRSFGWLHWISYSKDDWGSRCVCLGQRTGKYGVTVGRKRGKYARSSARLAA